MIQRVPRFEESSEIGRSRHFIMVGVFWVEKISIKFKRF